MGNFISTKLIELGSCAFRQWRATHSHCQFVHGYQLKAKIWFAADTLDDKNWVVDFGGLKLLKAELQGMYDHKLVVAEDDPLLDGFKEMHAAGACDLRIAKAVGAERTAEEVFNVANERIKAESKGRCRVTKVEVYEHDYNSAIYEEAPEVTIFSPDLIVGQPVSQNPIPEPIQAAPQQPVGRPANVGGNVTSGKGGWFSGTTWG